jgi:hypothetical protein
MDEKITLKFRKVMTSIGHLQKSEYYTFSFTKDTIEIAKERDINNPFLIFENSDILALYSEEGKLIVKYYTSYYKFKEGLGEHGLNKTWEYGVLCKCGKFFANKKRKQGIDYLNKHIKHIEGLNNG